MRLLCLGGLLFACASAQAEPTITHGPILGRLGTDHVGVWARTKQPETFRVRYGTDPKKLDQFSEPATTRLAHDNTGWVLLTGLDSNTTYHYQIDGTDLDGSFRTLPTPEDYRNPEHNPNGLFNFKFEFACGNNQTPGQGGGPALPTFKTMLRELKGDIDFAILNGDWLYEDKRDTTVEQWREANGVAEADVPEVLRIAPTLPGVWENYKAYLTRGEPLNPWHRNVPSFFTFDDHEMLNDIWGAGTPGLRDRRAVFRDIGTQAWYDYLGWSNPITFKQGITFGKAQLKKGSDVLTDPNADFTKLDLEQANNLHVHWGTPTAGVNDNDLDGVGGDPNAGVYEIVEVLGKDRLKVSPAADADGDASYSIGRRSYYRMRVSNCDFFILDTRGQRQMHDTKDPAKKGISMLGPKQKKWLMDGMKASDAEFFFVVSSVNFMVPHVGGGKVRATNKDDAWTVFLDEREQLIQFWDSLGKPVCVLTGDLHNSFAIKITDRVWEFASGPHNSNNHIAGDEGDRPANGVYDSRGRKCDIRWSSFFLDDIPRDQLQHPHYCVVQVNNVFNSPLKLGDNRWVTFPRPQVIFQYYDGRTGKLKYAEPIHSLK